MSFPLIISIILNMVYEQEECGGFQYFLTTPNKKYLPHFSKLISIIILGLVSTLIAILGFGIMFYIMGNDSIEISFYYKETLIVFSSNILLYMIFSSILFWQRCINWNWNNWKPYFSTDVNWFRRWNMASDTLGIFNEIIFLLYIV